MSSLYLPAIGGFYDAIKKWEMFFLFLFCVVLSNSEVYVIQFGVFVGVVEMSIKIACSSSLAVTIIDWMKIRLLKTQFTETYSK